MSQIIKGLSDQANPILGKQGPIKSVSKPVGVGWGGGKRTSNFWQSTEAYSISVN